MLAPCKKTYDQTRQHIKSRDITLSTKIHLVKPMVFPVVMYGCESWTIKKAEYWRIDAFELWCWRRLLRVSWTARRSNQSILKEISPDYSLEGLMLKLMKFQYFGHLIGRTDSFEKTLTPGKIEGRRKRGWQRMRWLDGKTNLTEMSFSKFQELVMNWEAWHAPVHGITELDMTEWLNWTDWLYVIYWYKLPLERKTDLGWSSILQLMDSPERDSAKSCKPPKLPAARKMSVSVLKGVPLLFTVTSTATYFSRHVDVFDSYNTMEIASLDSTVLCFLGWHYKREVGLRNYNPWLLIS